jgi:hypothetical protein
MPAFEQLCGLDRAVLYGLLAEHGDPAWAEPVPKRGRWLQGSRTWDAVESALNAAAAGTQPAALRERPPRWLNPLVQRALQENDGLFVGRDFAAVRLLERLGLVSPEHDVNYLRSWLGYLTEYRRHSEIAGVRDQRVRADPELIPLLWDVFRIQPDEIRVSQWDVGWQRNTETSWTSYFGVLIRDGFLDRGRVLTSCLQALAGELRQAPARWYAGLYNSLEPSDSETAERQTHLRALLRSEHGSTLNLALEGLRRLDRLGLLDDDACADLASAVRAPAKATALTTLKLAAAIAKRRPDLHRSLAEVTAVGLEHSNPDVQTAAAELLKQLDAADRTEAAVADLSPVARDRLGLAVADPAQAPIAVRVPAPVIGGRDALDLAACLLEDSDDPVEFELGLAALATLSDPARLAPLAKRARKVLEFDGSVFQPEHRLYYNPAYWPRGQFARLVLLATETSIEVVGAQQPRVGLLVARLEGVGKRLTGHRSREPLLATPTTDDGRLMPAVLVERLAACVEPPDLADVIAALLRLDFDGRNHVLPLVQGDDEVARAVRHALGAAPSVGPLTTPALWVAASRARAPQADDPLLISAGLDQPGQGRPVRARFVNTVGVPDRWHTPDWSHVIEVDGGMSTTADPLQPTLATQDDTGISSWFGALAFSTPHDLEPLLTDAIDIAFCAGYAPLDQGSAQGAGRFLDALGRHSGPIGPLGCTALGAVLNASRGDLRVHAVDVVAGYVADQRLTPAALAEGMMSVEPRVVCERWAAALTDLGVITGRFPFDVLVALLPRMAPDRRGLHSLVECLLSEAIRTGARVTDLCFREWVGSLTGKGKAARAAAQVLQLP